MVDIEPFDAYRYRMDGPPAIEPIGLQLTRTARLVSRAFDEALGASGGTLPTWQVLVSLKGEQHGAQRHLARALGIEGPTLTHHLNRMEAAGLVTRTRDPGNRRVHRVELTEEGQRAFHHLRKAVVAFDRRLRDGLSESEVATLSSLLGRLRANVAPPVEADVERQVTS
jgi:MarR family transcriptional regulator, transcriptional regulator for hemolysin